MSSGPASRSRKLLWLIPLVLLPPALLLAILAAAHVLGLRLQGPGWQDGATVAGWQWQPEGCVTARGEKLRIESLRPLRLHLARLELPTCPSTKPLTSPPWTPPFDLTIDRIILPGLPPAAAVIHQRGQRWQVQLRYQGSQASALYNRHSGQWRAQGQLLAADIAPEFLGTLDFMGQGLWQGERLEGKAQATGRQLGYAGQPQRSDAALSARYADKQWQVTAALADPMALGSGWSLEARQALEAKGSTAGVDTLRLDLLAAGPQGTVQLVLDNESGSVARGQGRLTLAGPALGGQVPLRWSRERLQLQPAAVRLPEGLRLSWSKAVAIPLATKGASNISAELAYRDLRVSTTDSHISWEKARWQWLGRLDLSGKYEGYALDGFWQGHMDPEGPHGEPARLNVKGQDLNAVVQIPVTELRPPHWATRASFKGRYSNYPASGTLGLNYAADQLQGELEAGSRLPFYTQGGALKISGPWQQRNGQWFLAKGGRLTLAEGLIGSTVIKPVILTAETPLRLGEAGIFGKALLQSEGLVAARSTIPAISGPVDLNGKKGRARLRLPAWQSEVDISAELLDKGRQTAARGTVALSTPLSAAMSRGLPVTLKQGQLKGQGRWQWQERWRLEGEASVSGLALDWGGIPATGGQGAVRFSLNPEGGSVASQGPLQVAEVDVGTPVKNISLGLRSDFSAWHFSDVYAEALGGKLLAPVLHWPATEFQQLGITGIDLAQVAALQTDKNPTVQLGGRVGGTLPLQLLKDSLAVKGGQLSNEGPLLVKVRGSESVSAMGQSNQAVSLVLDTLSHLAVHDFLARVDMQPDGWLDAAVTIKGQNPQKKALPVVLNYTHRENVFELLRSLRIADEISRQVLDKQPADGKR